MIEILEMLEKMKETQIVRFFARFFTEERLSPLLGNYKDKVTGDAAGLAREFLGWAVALAIIVFLIDQIIYWTAPGRVYQARENWYAFRDNVRAALHQTAEFLRRLGGQVRAMSRGRR